MANPPRSMAVKPANAPESFPMGVRAPATMTASAIACTSGSRRSGYQSETTSYWATIVGSHERHPAVLSWPAPAADELAALPLPDSYRAAIVKRSEVDMFEGMESSDKDPRRSLHVEEVPLPELAPDEAYVAVMASSINFNTVWTSIFEPLPTFGFLDRLAKEGPWAARHALDYHVVGSDAAGVVLRTGSAVRNWKVGDKVTVHCNYVDDQDPSAHDDSMLAANQRIWGFESNFGGLADIAVVKANQLMPKPAHLSWEEAAINALCNSTAYRMLVSPNGARMTQGDKVLVWGASGGLGSYAVQHVLNGGGTPIGVVSSPEKVKLLNDLGVEAVIDRKAAGYRFWSDEHTQDESEWRRLGKDIRGLVGSRARDRLRAPGAPDDGGVGVRLQARRDDRDLRRHLGLHDRVRQPPPLDEAQDHQGLPLRQLPGGLGRQPAHLPTARCSRRSPPSTRWSRWARRRTRSTTTCTRARSACCAWHRVEGLGIDDPELRAKVGEDRITLFRRHGA